MAPVSLDPPCEANGDDVQQRREQQRTTKGE